MSGRPEVDGAPSPDLTVIVVTYDSGDFVEGAIESARASAGAAGLAAEIIVVDNASTDGTADLVATEQPDVVLIRNDRNVGFGAANNAAFGRARGRWWLLLNPDARIDEAALGRLAAALAEDEHLAAVGPSISGAGMGTAESAGELPGIRSLAAHFLLVNRLLPGDRGGPWRGWQLRTRRAGGPATRLRPVGWLSGAAMLLRPEAVRAVGGFDESIFLYGEDTELGFRLREAGWRLALDPGARARHAIGGSQGPASTRWIAGLDAYLARRGRSGPARRACMLVIAIGLGVRTVAASLAGGGDRRHRMRMRAGALEALRRAATRRDGSPES